MNESPTLFVHEALHYLSGKPYTICPAFSGEIAEQELKRIYKNSFKREAGILDGSGPSKRRKRGVAYLAEMGGSGGTISDAFPGAFRRERLEVSRGCMRTNSA